MRSVAYRSRCMIPNPGKMTDGLREVRRFDSTKSRNAMAKDVAIKILDIMALCVHSGNRKSVVSSPRLRKLQQPMLCISISSLSYCIGRFCCEMSIIDMYLLIQNERCPVQSWIWVAAERPFGTEPLLPIGASTVKARITRITLTIILLRDRIAITAVSTIHSSSLTIIRRRFAVVFSSAPSSSPASVAHFCLPDHAGPTSSAGSRPPIDIFPQST
jgi:hypothetical protein